MHDSTFIQNFDLSKNQSNNQALTYTRERKKATMETAETRKARLQCDSGTETTDHHISDKIHVKLVWLRQTQQPPIKCWTKWWQICTQASQCWALRKALWGRDWMKHSSIGRMRWDEMRWDEIYFYILMYSYLNVADKRLNKRKEGRGGNHQSTRCQICSRLLQCSEHNLWQSIALPICNNMTIEHWLGRTYKLDYTNFSYNQNALILRSLQPPAKPPSYVMIW